MIVGFFLIFAAVLVFFAQKKYLSEALAPIFGPYYRWFFSPIAVAVGAHMAFGKSSFDVRRGLGLLFFWMSSVSIWCYFAEAEGLFFDIHTPLIEWFDKIPAITLLFGFLLFSLYLLFHVSYRKILSQFKDAGGYAVRKQVEMLNSFSDSIRERQEEAAKFTPPKEEKRLRSRNDELESKIEKLTNRKTDRDEDEKPSFLDKLRNRGTVADIKPEISPMRGIKDITPMRVPVITKNISTEKHSDIKPFQGSWQYPRSDLLSFHPKGKPLTKEEVELQSAIIEKTLLQFGIEVHMAGYQVGPTVTQYRLRPSEGVKL